jgi:hypothetical protein
VSVTPLAKKSVVSTPVTASKTIKKDSSSDSDSSDDDKNKTKATQQSAAVKSTICRLS